MRWIVGTDLGPRSAGALALGAWLREHSNPVSVVHVLEGPPRIGEAVDAHIVAGVAAVHAHLRALGLDGVIDEVQAIPDGTPELGLAAAIGTAAANGVIVGRASPRAGAFAVRLGRSARRLLRQLPAPIMVVPPDLDIATLGAGPVVLATCLRDDSNAAGAVARRLADDLARPLLVIHVDPALVLADSRLSSGMPMPEELRPRTHADLEAWIAARGLGPAQALLLEGDTVERVLACARDQAAPLVCCGSRRLGLIERIFGTSVGTELARLADRAVLVVPPDNVLR